MCVCDRRCGLRFGGTECTIIKRELFVNVHQHSCEISLLGRVVVSEVVGELATRTNEHNIRIDTSVAGVVEFM